MINNSLAFTGSLDYGSYCSFRVAVATVDISCAISFFGYTDTLREFGRQLADFPTDTQREVLFQQGEDDSSRLEYLLLKAYYLDRTGHAALQIVMDNKASPPFERRVAFSLAADVSSLVALGRALLGWQLQPGTTSSVEWHPVVS